MAGVFEHFVHGALDIFPESVAPGFNDHAAADGGVFGEVGCADDLLVPFWIVFLAGGGDGGFGFLVGGLFSHDWWEFELMVEFG